MSRFTRKVIHQKNKKEVNFGAQASKKNSFWWKGIKVWYQKSERVLPIEENNSIACSGEEFDISSANSSSFAILDFFLQAPHNAMQSEVAMSF